MALPTRPLSIKDACTTARSIAQEVDGNLTGDKTLWTLGTTAGKTSGGVYMSEFEGYASTKTVCYCTYFASGGCGGTGPVNDCSCLVVNSARVSGDRFDANICYWLCNPSAAGLGCSCVTFRRNGTTIAGGSFIRTTVGLTTGVFTVQDVVYNDAITIQVYATAPSAVSVYCACTCLNTLTDQVQSTFAKGTPAGNFVIAQKAF
jgi:hypothetical protein